MTILKLMAGALLLPAAFSQSLTTDLIKQGKARFDRMNQMLLKSAEAMPEEHYRFKPSPDVRSFGEVIAHVILVESYLCTGTRGGDTIPNQDLDRKAESKQAMVGAMKELIEYCKAGLDSLSETTLYKLPNAKNPPTPGSGMRALISVNYHTAEHWGNIVTYMREKGIVPPSTPAPGPPPASGKN